MPPVDDKIMTFRLAADGFYNGRVQPVTAAFAQRAQEMTGYDTADSGAVRYVA